ncbi:metallophosphoesterase [Persicobacter diffluens]|uniref:Phosphoesterase n=1 Tax=Persicobacter diffluens TaxID=981 RepID=A0AAN5AJQ6_9BACT|nr:phosphoesterase [Persicobacter diffluens]
MSLAKFFPMIVFMGVMLLLDLYIYQAVKVVSDSFSAQAAKWIKGVYWAFSFLCLGSVVLMATADPLWVAKNRQPFLTVLSITYFSKMIGSLFLVLDDVLRGVRWMTQFLQSTPELSGSGESTSPIKESDSQGISRGEFLSKAGLVGVGVPVATMSFGIISGAHDYRVRKKTVVLKNLPPAFDGIKVAQLSDIHTGSFFNKTAVKGGVEMLMAEKPDMVFFTGDLVNNEAREAREYVPIFEKVKADLGVYSVMGNHDYGDYHRWASPKSKQENLKALHTAHHEMGWDLLLDENRTIQVDGAEVGVIGVQNWGTGGFAQYGNLEKAYRGMEETEAKILLSHDPSHWDAQVRPAYSAIDLTLSGHTHGFQFGVEIGDFRWSPAQWRYKQWADLYQEKDQYLYVNRGFGYIGYPGRIGILPEITILELKREQA